MYLLQHVPLPIYFDKWMRFDESCRQLEAAGVGLSPFDRHEAWVEFTADEYVHELPVPMSHFLLDPYYVGTDISVRPKIEEFLVDFFAVENAYEVFVFIGGIGAGKSFSASLGMEYMLYQLSCLRHPQRYLNGLPGVWLSGDAEIVFINASAAGQRQGQKIVYSETFTKILASPYFSQHFPPYDGKASEMEFPHRIRMSPSTSQAQSVLGFNLFAFVLDEAAFGMETERADYVKDLFLALNQRRRSRFGRWGMGGMYTSPGSEYGFVEGMAAEGMDWDTSIMVRRITTWDAKDEIHPGAHIFLLDRHPDVVRILASDLTLVSDELASGGDLICQTATGELVTVRNRSHEELPHAA